MKYQLLKISLVCAGLAVPLAQGPLIAQPPKPAVLPALRRIDIKKELARRGFGTQHPSRIAAGGSHLLVTTAGTVSGLNGVLTLSNIEGNIRWTLPVEKVIMHTVVDQVGQVAALVEEAPPDQEISLLRLGADGIAVGDPRRLHRQGDVFRLLFAESSLFGLTRSGFLRNLTDRNDGGRQVMVGGTILQSVDTFVHSAAAGRFRVIDARDAAWAEGPIYSGRAADGSNSSLVAISHPAIERAKATYSNLEIGANGIVVLAATGDEVGRSYCLLTGFRPGQGAPVLVLDEHGKVARELRLDVSSGGTVSVPVSIAAAAGRLAMLDSLGVITVFSLPDGR